MLRLVQRFLRDTVKREGLRGEQRVSDELAEQGWAPVGKTQTSGGDFDSDLAAYQGRQGIDGVYVRGTAPNQEFIIVETKATQGQSAGGLNTMSDGQTKQMSKEWVDGRIENNLDGDELAAYELAKASGKVKFVKADVTGVDPNAPAGSTNGTVKFTKLEQEGDTGVKIGGSWDPQD